MVKDLINLLFPFLGKKLLDPGNWEFSKMRKIPFREAGLENLKNVPGNFFWENIDFGEQCV